MSFRPIGPRLQSGAKDLRRAGPIAQAGESQPQALFCLGVVVLRQAGAEGRRRALEIALTIQGFSRSFW